MNSSELKARLEEFERNIWDHSEDEFQQSFDRREPLSEKEVAALRGLIEMFGRGAAAEELSAFVRQQIRGLGEEYFHLLLQLVGLTRNKILTDLKASASGGPTRVRMPSGHWGIVGSDAAWGLAGPYLVAKLKGVFTYLAEYDDAGPGLQALNQATWPGWVRQERAKRQGHEAEGRLARVLAGVGIAFEPAQKAENPLCPDATVHGVSFDLVIPSAELPAVCVKSTVHTSNIGQYGESKDHLEVDEAKRVLDEKFLGDRRPCLIALIDGVGFRSNRAGLEGVLKKADEFCQFRTLWKAAVVTARAVGAPMVLWLPREAVVEHKDFLARYADKRIEVRVGIEGAPRDAVLAGDGRLARL